MKTTAQTKPPTSFGLILVGPPKSGKTSFALQFPKPYIADCDNNISGPFRFLTDQGKNPSFSYDTIDVDDSGKEVAAKDRWTRMTNCLKAAVASPDVETIIVDSLSKVSDYLIEHILATERITAMRIQDWGGYQNLFKRLITYLRSSGKLIIFCAHESVEKDELDGVLKYFIHLPSSLKNNIGGLFTDVWRAEYQPGAAGKDGKYTIRTVSSARMSLGNSLGLPSVVDMDFEKSIQPNLSKIL